jgi:hypothetical protein
VTEPRSSASSRFFLFASHYGLDLDWATYAPAGKGAEVHGAALPLLPGRTPDRRC